MTPDIFGIAFNDYLKGKKDGCIQIDCNVAETSFLPVAYFFRDFEMMPEGEQKIMKACSGNVLDVGAGAGSHALYLQKSGCDVTAIDFSPGVVDVMKKRGVGNVVCVDYFNLTGIKFDNILFIMNGAGIARTIEGLYRLFEHASTLLNKNGSIFIESTDILYMFEDDDGSFVIDLGADYYGEVVYKMKYKEIVGKEFKWLFVDRDNMADIAEKSGFKPTMFYDSGKGSYIMRFTF